MNRRSPDSRQAGIARVPLIISLVIILGCGAAGTYFLFRPKKVTAVDLIAPVQKLVESSCLPDDQKKRITADVERLASEAAEGRVTAAQSESIRARLFDGPFMDLLQVEVVRAHAAKLFEADAKRKQRNMLVLDRFERGIRERKFSQEQMDRVMAKVSRKNDKNRREIISPVTDGQVKGFITAAGLQVDAAKIPVKAYQADLAGEFHRAIAPVLWSTATSPGDELAAESQPEGPLTPPIDVGPPPASVPKASKAPARSAKKPSSPSTGGTGRQSRQRTQRRP